MQLVLIYRHFKEWQEEEQKGTPLVQIELIKDLRCWDSKPTTRRVLDTRYQAMDPLVRRPSAATSNTLAVPLVCFTPDNHITMRKFKNKVSKRLAMQK